MPGRLMRRPAGTVALEATPTSLVVWPAAVVLVEMHSVMATAAMVAPVARVLPVRPGLSRAAMVKRAVPAARAVPAV